MKKTVWFFGVALFCAFGLTAWGVGQQQERTPVERQQRGRTVRSEACVCPDGGRGAGCTVCTETEGRRVAAEDCRTCVGNGEGEGRRGRASGGYCYDTQREECRRDEERGRYRQRSTTGRRGGCCGRWR